MNDEDRTCRYGHGPLKFEPGSWGLQGITWMEFPGDDPKANRFPSPSGETFVVRVGVCRVCGYIELADEDEVKK